MKLKPSYRGYACFAWSAAFSLLDPLGLINVFLLLRICAEPGDVKDLAKDEQLRAVPEVDEVSACADGGLGRVDVGVGLPTTSAIINKLIKEGWLEAERDRVTKEKILRVKRLVKITED
jgi:hypothetical protein